MCERTYDDVIMWYFNKFIELLHPPIHTVGALLCSVVVIYWSNLQGPQFTKWTGVLPQDLVKYWSRENRVYTFSIALKFYRHIGSSAAEMPVKLESDTIVLTSNFAASTSWDLAVKTFYRLLNRSLIYFELFHLDRVNHSIIHTNASEASVNIWIYQLYDTNNW